jgi:prepilin-type N-terminal cleavage/methylation domain-containing protein
MKVYSSKAEKVGKRRQAAFTMIEMIGVLAVIAILAAMLIPRVFQAVDTARVTSTAVALETVKTAAIDHYGRQGRLDMKLGTPIDMSSGVYAAYDINVLMPEGLLEKPFTARLAGPGPGSVGDPTTNVVVQLIVGNRANNNTGYMLDGITNSVANSQYVLEAIINNCSAADAKELNDRIDGIGLGAPDLVTADNRGKVEYAAPANGTTTVYVYLTHR